MFITKDNASGEDRLLVRATAIGEPEELQLDEPYEDPLADVFDSAPATNNSNDHGNRRPNDNLSDVPRLRSIHVTNGYREGIAIGKEQTIQAGFDEGYALGAEFGMLVGKMIGAVDGLLAASRRKRHHSPKQPQSARQELDNNALPAASGSEQNPSPNQLLNSAHQELSTASAMAESRAEQASEQPSLEQLLKSAHQELDTAELFSPTYFDEQGIWKYTVAEGHPDTTFRVVAASHPIILKWAQVVQDAASAYKLPIRLTTNEPECGSSSKDGV